MCLRAVWSLDSDALLSLVVMAFIPLYFVSLDDVMGPYQQAL